MYGISTCQLKAQGHKELKLEHPEKDRGIMELQADGLSQDAKVSKSIVLCEK